MEITVTTFRRLVVVVLATLLSSCVKQEPFWSDTEISLLKSLSLASLSPPSTGASNRVADNRAAAEFGRSLFFDTRLSANNDLSCASCHQPDRQFTDGLPTGQGVNRLSRNTPTIIAGAWQDWFYWDGRRDSLWSQALIPIEAPDEMGGSRTGAVRLVAEDPHYRQRYTDLFGPLPAAVTSGDLPEHAGEFAHSNGKDAWFRMPQSTRSSINRVYANIGKSIAAFERTLVPKPTPFDRYVDVLISEGEQAASSVLGESAIRGAKLFIDPEASRCLQCHNGPLLTNGDFHNIGTANLDGSTLVPGQSLDFGRLFGVQAVLLDEFNCLGPHSDATPEQCSALRFLSREQHGDTAGAFKTPSLRNVALTGPYFYNGQADSIAAVMKHYISPPDTMDHELTPIELTESQMADMLAFLESLSSPTYSHGVGP